MMTIFLARPSLIYEAMPSIDLTLSVWGGVLSSTGVDDS